MTGTTNGIKQPGASSLAGAERCNGRPVIFGEVLFDTFPDGTRVLGGAPFNVAWHLQAFGLRPLLITRIGSDDAGTRVLEAMQAWGMDTAGVQRDLDRPTGEVVVEVDGGEPTFLIRDDQAFDHIHRAAAAAAVGGEETALLYHGTLVARHPDSREALYELRAASRLPCFLDVNLRDPWWSEETIRSAFFGTRWVKLNEAELNRLGLQLESVQLGDPLHAAQELRVRHALDTVIVTRGAEGAQMVDPAGRFTGAPPEHIEVVDTVGAGDAFSAVCIAGLIHGWTPELTLQRALAFAASICGIRGATSSSSEPYLRALGSWKGEGS